ncbi:hypothetical protein JCM11491_003237 [Sporobolomyces phaffii]
MFSQTNLNSPYRSSQPSQGYGTPQGGSSTFSQQQPSASSPFGGHAAGFSGPQFGGGNAQYGGAGGTPSSAGAGYGGTQFAHGGGGHTQATGGPYGSPFAAHTMHGSSGPGQGGAQGFGGEGKKRSYLPGYLSGGQPDATPPQAMSSDAWDSPAARKHSLSTSPAAARFGGGGASLFGSVRDNTPSKSPKFASYAAPSPRNPAYRNEMDEDAPPTASLNEFEPSESSDSNFAAFRAQTDYQTHSPFSAAPASSSSLLHTGTSSSTSSSSSTTYAVHVFGFPLSALDLVVDFFSQFGPIVSQTPAPCDGGNWVTLAYAEPWSALRAQRKNGEVLAGGTLMVGVKVVDEDVLKRALAAAESGGGEHAANSSSTNSGAGTPRPAAAAAPTSSSTIGRPVQVFGPASAFKSAATSTPTKRGFLGLGGGGGTPQQQQQQQQQPGSQSSTSVVQPDPHASLFADKTRHAALQQQQHHDAAASKGYLGKVSDLVFGW